MAAHFLPRLAGEKTGDRTMIQTKRGKNTAKLVWDLELQHLCGNLNVGPKVNKTEQGKVRTIVLYITQHKYEC